MNTAMICICVSVCYVVYTTCVPTCVIPKLSNYYVEETMITRSSNISLFIGVIYIYYIIYIDRLLQNNVSRYC